MIAPPRADASAPGGWWAIDVAGYLLTRLDALTNDVTAPPALDEAAIVAWIRRNELPWAPGMVDPAAEIPWSVLHSLASEGELIEHVLTHAADELNAVAGDPQRREDVRLLAARRLLPMSSLHVYGLTPRPVGAHDGDFADGHVHQSAALPFEVTLRWMASATTSFAKPDRNRLLTDTTGSRFTHQPLLLLLRNLLETPERIDAAALAAAVAAAKGDGEAWSRFNAAAAFSEPSGADPLMMAAIQNEKGLARTRWTAQRRLARLRVEAILLGSVTPRRPGLDLFVELFDQFARLRQGRFSKEEHFYKSIVVHSEQSAHRLSALELRLGRRIASARHNKGSLEREYAAVLAGYRRAIAGQEQPIQVSFPLGLVKSARRSGERSDHWRFDPRGIFALTEGLLDLLETHPPVRPFVDGIDVSGLETEEPNWLFACAFERFAQATSGFMPRPACRFHAGEWQWTPLHGLRRIAEFVHFRLPDGTPRRLGHGLALKSSDWTRLAEQPLDELLDDLVWTYIRLQAIPCAVETRRLVERLIVDVRSIVYVPSEAREATIQQLVAAYLARFDARALERISFIRRDRGRLSFPDQPPATRHDLTSRLLIAHLGRGTVRTPSVATALSEEPALAPRSISDLHTTLLELYELLVAEIVDDLRWSGVVVEACPTSNVLAGGVRGYASHPMRSLVEAGILTTINTDDPSLFHSWMPDEIAHAQQTMGVPARSVTRSQQLGLSVVAPALRHLEVRRALDAAIDSLELQPVR